MSLFFDYRTETDNGKVFDVSYQKNSILFFGIFTVLFIVFGVTASQGYDTASFVAWLLAFSLLLVYAKESRAYLMFKKRSEVRFKGAPYLFNTKWEVWIER